MRLRFVQLVETQLPITLESDAHVLIDITIGLGARDSSPLYWQFIDESIGIGIVTIGLNRTTGLLHSLTVLYNGLIGQEKNNGSALSGPRVGLPQFALDLWRPPNDLYDISADYVDVRGQFRLSLSTSSLHLKLFDDEPHYSSVYDGRVICQFNRTRELSSIVIDKLLPQQISRIKQWYEPPS